MKKCLFAPCILLLFLTSCMDELNTLEEKETLSFEQSGTTNLSTLSTTPIDIQSAATTTFPDPFPVRPWITGGDNKYFYSTRAQILHCNGPVSANAFSQVGSVEIDHGILQKHIDNNTIQIVGYWAKNVYRDDLGNWHMVASPRIHKGSQKYTIIVHLKPKAGESFTAGNPIKRWIVNEVLIGDPLNFAYANYAGKYYKDSNGVLYLIYVDRVPGTQKNGIYAQRMQSTVEVNHNYAPYKLLTPGDFNSEYRNGTSGMKLIETGNVMKISGKYIIAYTVGDYIDDNYKLAIAWSDNLLGPYKKVWKNDVNNIWGNGAGEPEIYYLLQSQKNNWPNFVKGQVKAPGVPSINKDSNGKWYLFFAGLPPSETKTNGKYDPSKRRPYFVELELNIPAKTVSEATRYELKTWIKCKRQ